MASRHRASRTLRRGAGGLLACRTRLVRCGPRWSVSPRRFWSVTYQAESNSFEAEVHPDQGAAYLEAKATCDEEFAAENPLRPLDDADYKALYQQELATMACLEKEG